MIIIKIFGGLGNQMFQYAFGKALSLRYDRELVVDKSYFNKENFPFSLHPYHPYKLDLYNTTKEFVSPRLSKRINILRRKRIYKISNVIANIRPFNNFIPYYFSQTNFNFDLILKTKTAVLNGYWQKFNILDEYTVIIKSELTYANILSEKTKRYLEILGKRNSVAVHFRRGDYITNPQFKNVYATCSLDYYNHAMNNIAKKIDNPIFAIFSDSIGWVKSNLKSKFQIVFIDNIDADHEQLYLMSQCKHNVIANSSFSWWGAWLNNNPNKIVFAPKNWFISKNRKNDIYFPKEWNVIEKV